MNRPRARPSTGIPCDESRLRCSHRTSNSPSSTLDFPSRTRSPADAASIANTRWKLVQPDTRNRQSSARDLGLRVWLTKDAAYSTSQCDHELADPARIAIDRRASLGELQGDMLSNLYFQITKPRLNDYIPVGRGRYGKVPLLLRDGSPSQRS